MVEVEIHHRHHNNNREQTCVRCEKDWLRMRMVLIDRGGTTPVGAE